jgi:ergothioneine biosynthesis protein EgtB
LVETLSQTAVLDSFSKTRNQTNILCESLEKEDFVVQPTVDVSPLKWHLAHTTWFFEQFVLKEYSSGYEEFHPMYSYLFNSYYITAGDRWTREKRGQLTRPTVDEIFDYRAYVNDHLTRLLAEEQPKAINELIELGVNHEQQHQELFLYDVKRILGDNPIYPPYQSKQKSFTSATTNKKWLTIDEGLYEIGFDGDGFCFDNELGKHNVFLHDFEIQSGLITNGEFLEFMEDGGYQTFSYWLSDGWDWVNKNKINAPRYWDQADNKWHYYTLNGHRALDLDAPLCHISYYEAEAFARWRGCRLPTEVEWEIACKLFEPQLPENANFIEQNIFEPFQTGTMDFYGNVWEWTSSPYTPYPFFKVKDGAIGEYNGKFMVNQIVLRGGSFATSYSHIRPTYRNFFHPNLRWLFSGFRLARHRNQ